MHISYNNTEYMIGGWWQINPANKAEKRISRQYVVKEYNDLHKNEELENKDQLKFDYLLRVPGRYAFFKKENNSVKVFSLAYSLAKKVENLIAIVELEGKYWAVCIQGGYVLPEGDNVFLSILSAKDHILSNGFVSDDEDIQLISDYKEYFSSVGLIPSGQLEDIKYNLFSNRNIAIGMIFLLAAGIYLWFQYMDAAEREKIRRLDILRGQEIAQMIEEAKNNPERYFDKPFEEYQADSNKNFLKNVAEDFRRLKEYVNGWQIDKVVYHKNKRVITWTGDGEYLALPENGEIRGKNVVSTTQKQYLVTEKDVFGRLNNKDDIQRYLYSLTANSQTTLSVSWGAAKKKVVNIESKKVELYEPWETGSFSISNIPYNLLIDSNFSELLSVYGLVVEQIEFQNFYFTLRGKIFVNKG